MEFVNWSVKDSELSDKEGWNIYDTSFEVEKGCFKIKKNEGDNTFQNDEEAFSFVKKLAENGSAFHKKALEFINFIRLKNLD